MQLKCRGRKILKRGTFYLKVISNTQRTTFKTINDISYLMFIINLKNYCVFFVYFYEKFMQWRSMCLLIFTRYLVDTIKKVSLDIWIKVLENRRKTTFLRRVKSEIEEVCNHVRQESIAILKANRETLQTLRDENEKHFKENIDNISTYTEHIVRVLERLSLDLIGHCKSSQKKIEA